jgi:hypothetical protein
LAHDATLVSIDTNVYREQLTELKSREIPIYFS